MADALAALTVALAKSTDPGPFLMLYHDALEEYLVDGGAPDAEREVEVRNAPPAEQKSRRRRGFRGMV